MKKKLAPPGCTFSRYRRNPLTCPKFYGMILTSGLMVFNIKHFFVDSENVNDNWLMLLDMSSEDDRITVFYTKNSPRMSYTSVIKLVENNRNIEFEECFEGSNALDFQLVSYLGYVMQTETAETSGDAEFIIMSNDTGFDPVVSFWKKKGFSVIRINVNYCKMALQRQKSSAAGVAGKSRTRTKLIASGDLTALSDKAAASQELPTEDVPVEAAPTESAESTPVIVAEEMPETKVAQESAAVSEFYAEVLSKAEMAARSLSMSETMSDAPADLLSEQATASKMLPEGASPADVVSDALPTESKDSPSEILPPAEADASAPKEDAPAEVITEEIISAETAPMQPVASRGERKSRSRNRRKSAAARAAAAQAAATAATGAQATATEAQATGAQAAADPTRAADDQLPQANTQSQTNTQPQAAMQPQINTQSQANTQSPVKTECHFNKDEVDTLINCLGRDNLTLIHETLVHVYGQKPGQTIYKTVKEKNYPFTSVKYSRTDKVKHFSDIIFSHADIQDPGSFVDFLESNKDNSKNLNKVRAAITKAYGEGDGIKCYNLFKPYFKIISALK